MSSPHSWIARALVAVLVTLGGVTAVPGPAQAAVRTLCEGYKACADAGMGHAGYAKAGSSMYWRMYAGHNCTNYVAYRLVQSGMPNVRPWDGGGNATYWGTYMSSITDQTPTVGSVAWWKAGVYPAGSAGHVAYVEEVVSPDEIIVSQDFWGGDFSWARITKGSKGWPNGFIHFNDAPLVNVEKPALTGTPKVGAVLTASPGAWNPGEVQTEYRWLVDGKRIPDASAQTLTVDEGLLGRRIKVRVFASQVGYPTAKATSSATPAVLPGTLRSTSPPVVSGEAVVDGTLSVTAGQWDPVPDSVSYQWYAGGKPIPGADSPDLTLTPELLDAPVSVGVTGHRASYDSVTASTEPVVVRPGTLTQVGRPALEGTPRPGERLRLTVPETVEESGISIRWLRDGTLVDGATGRTYGVSAEDLGSRITAQVTRERPGYTPLAFEAATKPVRSPSTVEVDAVRTGRWGNKVRIEVSVAAADVASVTGLVRFRALRSTTTKDLRDGSARLILRKVPKKSFRLRVVHPASATTERSVEILRVARR